MTRFRPAMLSATGRVRPSPPRSIARDRSLERLSADSRETVSRFEPPVGQWTRNENAETRANSIGIMTPTVCQQCGKILDRSRWLTVLSTDKSDIHIGSCWFVAKVGDEPRLSVFNGHRGSSGLKLTGPAIAVSSLPVVRAHLCVRQARCK
jgi:hypothetical protein